MTAPDDKSMQKCECGDMRSKHAGRDRRGMCTVCMCMRFRRDESEPEPESPRRVRASRKRRALPDAAGRADLLCSALAARDVVTTVPDTAMDGVYVNVYAFKTARYPSHSVLVNDDGYTWGGHFEHSAPVDMAPMDIAAAILNTEGVDR